MSSSGLTQLGQEGRGIWHSVKPLIAPDEIFTENGFVLAWFSEGRSGGI